MRSRRLREEHVVIMGVVEERTRDVASPLRTQEP